MVRLALVALAAALPLVAGPAAAHSGACADLLPSVTLSKASVAKGRTGPLAAADLVRLRQFGAFDARHYGPSPLAVAPDRTAVALVLRRADPDSNGHCLGLVVVPLGGGAPRLLDTGSTLLREVDDFRNLGDLQSGVPRVLAPRWSSDGRFVFYLKGDGDGIAQVWQVALDGSGAKPVTRSPVHVIDFTLSAGEQAILYSSRPGLVAARAAIAAEGRQGWVHDERFWTLQSTRPFPPQPPVETRVLDLVSSRERPASAQESELLRAAVEQQGSPPSQRISADGRLVATLGAFYPGRFVSPNRLSVTRGGQPVACPDTVCGSRVWDYWIDGSDLIVQRTRFGAYDGSARIVRWRPGAPGAWTIWSGRGMLTGCRQLPDRLICGFEDAVTPRRLVTLDLASGRRAEVFDPNPNWSGFKLGQAQRLTWTDRAGVPTYGDLVLPVGHRPGQQHPLIVVQYEARGFLLGGTGNEYPVQLFATHGYAVLVVERPTAWLDRNHPATDFDAYQRSMTKDLFFRRAVLRSLEAGVDAALATGTIDPERIGITGLSDGADTACFALINARRFKAAAISSGCEDPATFMAMVGPSFTASLVAWGYPPPYADEGDFWRTLAPARNADRIAAPVLIQASDSEMRGALEMVTALRLAKKPVELITYPGEWHVKWQPAHRMAVFETSLAWFDFWLRGLVPPEPERARRWLALRDGSGGLQTDVPVSAAVQ